jgi:type I restriction enzyme R subunit
VRSGRFLPFPDELWEKTFAVQNEWREKFAAIPLRKRRYLAVRLLSELAVKNTLEALANNEDRILLTLAGTGKRQCISDSVETVSNPLEPKRDGSRRPRILFFLTEHLSRSGIQFLFAFPDDALIRIKTKGIKKRSSY